MLCSGAIVALVENLGNERHWKKGLLTSESQRNTNLLSYQPRVTVTSCFVYNVIKDLSSINHLCFNPILRIGLIHK